MLTRDLLGLLTILVASCTAPASLSTSKDKIVNLKDRQWHQPLAGNCSKTAR